jgi:hypothetical protein
MNFQPSPEPPVTVQICTVQQGKSALWDRANLPYATGQICPLLIIYRYTIETIIRDSCVPVGNAQFFPYDFS